MFSVALLLLLVLLVVALAICTPTAAAGTDATNANSTSTSTATSSLRNIEPDVRRYTNVLPQEVCQKLIQLGETAGFPLEHDSIDQAELKNKQNKFSQAIDVMDEDGIVNYPDIFEVLEPYIPSLAKLIVNQRDKKLHQQMFPKSPERLPKLGWIFYRKYSPTSARNSLVPHYDSNMHTVNIALNDDFTGGGLFFVKPLFEKNPDWIIDNNKNNASNKDHHNYDRGESKDDVPELLYHQYSYKWVNSLEHKNTSDVVFPMLETGDVLIHNYTVWHAVAPLQTGTRYSMVLFFDMDNPVLERNSPDYDADYEADDKDDDEDDHEDENDDENDDEDDYMQEVIIKHEIKECDPITGKLVYVDHIDIIWVDPDAIRIEEKVQERSIKNDPTGTILHDYLEQQAEHYHLVTLNLSPDVLDENLCDTGHTFRAVRSLRKEGKRYDDDDDNILLPLSQREVLGEIVIEPNKKSYEFVGRVTSQQECDHDNIEDEL